MYFSEGDGTRLLLLRPHHPPGTMRSAEADDTLDVWAELESLDVAECRVALREWVAKCSFFFFLRMVPLFTSLTRVFYCHC